ncbi:MAG: tRNA epoxyqueuosine(34) reductase QueG, partial [Candidatus Dadabacteria bacterium]
MVALQNGPVAAPGAPVVSFQSTVPRMDAAALAVEVVDARTSDKLVEQIRRTGFDLVGIAPTTLPDAWRARFEDWLARGFHGEMNWMKRSADERAQPRVRAPWVRAVIVVALAYDRPDPEPGGIVSRISRYARGRSYHNVMRRRLRKAARVLEQYGASRVAFSSDTAPVAERELARLAGLGWIGRHSLLLHPRLGSYLFLGTLFCDLELKPGAPMASHCGTCTACVDACPTNAIVADGVVDARRCISYLNIEHRGPFDPPYDADLHGWLHGCDLCQEVCPFVARARRAGLAGDEAFSPREVWRQVRLA